MGRTCGTSRSSLYTMGSTPCGAAKKPSSERRRRRARAERLHNNSAILSTNKPHRPTFLDRRWTSAILCPTGCPNSWSGDCAAKTREEIFLNTGVCRQLCRILKRLTSRRWIDLYEGSIHMKVAVISHAYQ